MIFTALFSPMGNIASSSNPSSACALGHWTPARPSKMVMLRLSLGDPRPRKFRSRMSMLSTKYRRHPPLRPQPRRKTCSPQRRSRRSKVRWAKPAHRLSLVLSLLVFASCSNTHRLHIADLCQPASHILFPPFSLAFSRVPSSIPLHTSELCTDIYTHLFMHGSH